MQRLQIKKLASGALGLLMTGASLMGGAWAQNLADYNTAFTAANTIVAVGATAATADVVGAINIATDLGQHGIAVTGAAAPGAVTGGISMATSSDPLTVWNNLASARNTLTASNLPNVLPSGSYVDANGVSYSYSQYLQFTDAAANGQVVYDRATGGTRPELGLRFQSTNSVFNHLLTFTKRVAGTSSSTTGEVSAFANTQLNFLGRDFTVTKVTAKGANNVEFTMLAGRTSKTVLTGTPVTFTEAGKTYDVELVSVGTLDGVDAANLRITPAGGSAETLAIKTGQTKTLSDGTVVGVTSIFKTTKTGDIDSAVVFVGADKVELSDSNTADTSYDTAGFKLNGVSQTDVRVRVTGSAAVGGGVNYTSIDVQYVPSTEQFVRSGQVLQDPAFKAFDIAFSGISPATDDTVNRETIRITPSATTTRLEFTTSGGKALNQDFATYSTSTSNVELQDVANRAIHLIEGEAVALNEYVVIGQNELADDARNPFGRILQLTSISTSTEATHKFRDVATGETIEAQGGVNPTVATVIDGYNYYVNLSSSLDNVKITWGAGAGFGSYGNAIDVYPAIETSKGATVAITAPVLLANTSGTNDIAINLAGTVLQFPTGTHTLPSAMGTPANNSATSTNTTGSAGVARYVVRNITNMGGAGVNLTIQATNNLAAVTAFDRPGVLVIEERDEAQTRNTIAIVTKDDDSNSRPQIQTGDIAFTASSTATSEVSGANQNEYMDQYGTHLTLSETNIQGKVSVSYPDSQSIAGVYVMEAGQAAPSPTGAVAGAATAVRPPSTGLSKLDTEVTPSDKSNFNFIVVGGPAVNALAADLQGVAFPTFGEASGVPTDGYIVKMFKDKFATGKWAILVAGWDADKTREASLQLMSGTLTGESVTG